MVESVFSVDGIGNALVNAALSRDYQLVQGLALVFGILVLLITLTVDITRAWLSLRGEPACQFSQSCAAGSGCRR